MCWCGAQGPFPGLSGALPSWEDGGSQAPAAPAQGLRRRSRGPSSAGSGPAVVSPPRLPRPGRHQRGAEISVPATRHPERRQTCPVEPFYQCTLWGPCWDCQSTDKLSRPTVLWGCPCGNAAAHGSRGMRHFSGENDATPGFLFYFILLAVLGLCYCAWLSLVAVRVSHCNGSPPVAELGF